MMNKIMVETKMANASHIHELQVAIGDNASILKSDHLDGNEILRLVVENAPSYGGLIASVVGLLRKNKSDVTIILPGGERKKNPTQDDINDFLKIDNNESN